MNNKNHLLIVICLLVLLLFQSACLSGSKATAIVTPSPQVSPVLTTSPAAVNTTPLPPGAITSLSEAGNAVIRVKSQGRFYDPPESSPQSIAGRGSGFIIDPSGIAVTNNHVVSGAETITVWIGDDQITEHSATVLGVSECYDLAVIDIEGEGYPYLVWNPDEAAFGQELGVGGFGVESLEYSLTKGIIMKMEQDGQTDRTSVETLLEHSARVPLGASGGPMLDLNGNVVGVHLGKTSISQWAEGLSATTAREITEQLIANGNLDTLGLSVQALADEGQGTSGVWVAGVQPGSAAAAAGIQAGDVITQLDQQSLGENGLLTEYCNILRAAGPGQPLNFEGYRSSTGEPIQGQLRAGGVAVPATPTPTEIPRVDGVLNRQAAEAGDVYFRYDFVEDLEGMDYFYTSGDPNSVSWEIIDGALRVEFQSIHTYIYFVYQQLTTPDVRLNIRVANLGENDNYSSLICRYTEMGWYEFSVSSTGLYQIYRYDPTLSDPYKELADGGSFSIRMGQKENDISAVCLGNQLTLYINGVAVRTVTNNELDNGRVGFSVASLTRPPVIVEIDQFEASVP